MNRRRLGFLSFVFGLALATACALANPLSPVSPQATASPQVTASPTATPEPLAASVNGEPISLRDFEQEVQRYEKAQAAMGIDLATLGDYRKRVLQALIQERVAAQAARAAGFQVTTAQVAGVVAEAQQARGGEEGFARWLAETGYTGEEFAAEAERQILVRLVTDRIASQVPTSAEQVHARQILVAQQDLGNQLLGELANRADFAELARLYSQDLSTRANGGDLGWFPRGWLAAPEVESAAFGLQAGQISQVVRASDGFHLVQVIERSASRPLTTEVLEAAQKKAVEEWLAVQVSSARLEIYVALQ